MNLLSTTVMDVQGFKNSINNTFGQNLSSKTKNNSEGISLLSRFANDVDEARALGESIGVLKHFYCSFHGVVAYTVLPLLFERTTFKVTRRKVDRDTDYVIVSNDLRSLFYETCENNHGDLAQVFNPVQNYLENTLSLRSLFNHYRKVKQGNLYNLERK